MCTVSYLPTRNGGFIFSSNRDEAPSRSTSEVVVEETPEGRKLLYPRDPQARGTWICQDYTGRLVCVLNGAAEQHRRQPPYRRSRGLVLLDAFTYENVHDFMNDYSFEGIEPFTMIIYDRQQLFELRWDSRRRTVRKLPSYQAHLWSSATLYSAEVMSIREALFQQWLKKQDAFTMDSVLQFHQSGGTGSIENDFLMNRKEIVRTISITSIEQKEGSCTFLYKNLINDLEIKKQFTIEASSSVVAPD